MHVVVFSCRGQQYAIASAAIVEVVPLVEARPITGSPVWLRGLVDYRGDLVPLLDAARLLDSDAEVNYRQSSRIVVLQVNAEGTEGRGRVGLLVEHVVGTETLDFDREAAGPGFGLSQVEFLGPVARTPGGTVQLIVPARLPTTAKLNKSP